PTTILSHSIPHLRPPTPTRSPYTTLFRSRGTPTRRRGPRLHRERALVRRGGDVPRRGAGGARKRGRRTGPRRVRVARLGGQDPRDRKSTRLNSSHLGISYAVFCLKKKNVE